MQKDILFIDAVCKSREKFLLGSEKYARLIDANTYEDGLKLLREYNFGKSAGETADLSQLIYAEEEDLIAFIKEYAPKDGTHNYFLLPYDFLNAEALFKCAKLNLPEEKYLTHEGLLTIAEVKDAVNGKKCKIKEINEAVIESEKLFDEGTPTGATVDTVFIRKLYTATYRLCKDKNAIKLMQREIDFKNISIILRSESEEEYESLKLPYGKLTKQQEDSLLTKDGDKILQAFKGSVYYDFVAKAVKNIGKPLTDFERLADSYDLIKLKETRFYNQGTEPYLLYVCYRKADIKNVRLILVSLRSDVSRDVIREKLRESY